MTATASTVMDSEPTVLCADDTVGHAIELIMQHRYRSIPVVDNGGKYLGTFGVNCLLSLTLPKAVLLDRGLNSIPYVNDSLADLHERLMDVENLAVSECVNHDLPVVGPDTPLVETLLVLYRWRASLPVVDPASRKLLGMISYFDIGRHLLAERPRKT